MKICGLSNQVTCVVLIAIVALFIFGGIYFELVEIITPILVFVITPICAFILYMFVKNTKK